ncbi:MAG TPA: hypothetical protein VEA38_17215 [Terriglobales bacterium]|nr:hypothetical protein [Terriglobales bacterium]
MQRSAIFLVRCLIAVSVLFAVVGGSAGPVIADGACASLSGAAHGLCNAYCEAMECGTANQKASPLACDRVKSNYRKAVGDPSASLPCEAKACLVGVIESLECRVTADTSKCFQFDFGAGSQSLSCVAAAADGGCPSGYIRSGNFGNECVLNVGGNQPLGATCNPTLEFPTACAQSGDKPIICALDDAAAMGGTVAYNCQPK